LLLKWRSRPIAPVGSWTDPPDGGAVAPGGDFVLKRESLPGWEQVRERAFRAG
jgi:hypothetical protein